MHYRFRATVAIVFSLNMLLMGCSHSDSGQNVHYTPQQLAAIQADFQSRDPDARVGVVAQVDSASDIATVAQVRVRDFQREDVITFIDEHGNILTTGRVVGANSSGLLVQFSQPTHGQHAPDVGDLAVRAVK
jgi:hypothetical protein